MALPWAVEPSAFSVPVAQFPLPPLLPLPPVPEPLLLLLLELQAASVRAAAAVAATSHTPRFSFTWWSLPDAIVDSAEGRDGTWRALVARVNAR
jgi:hypothetical protein